MRFLNNVGQGFAFLQFQLGLAFNQKRLLFRRDRIRYGGFCRRSSGGQSERMKSM